jgi:hypothetical protein
MPNNFPLKSTSKKALTSKRERASRQFLVSTFSFALTLLVGCGAVYSFTRQADIAKAFIPPQPLQTGDQFSKSGCYNQFDRKDVMPGDLLYCDFQLSNGSSDLNTADYKYFGLLAIGDEKATNQLASGDQCEYNESSRILRCNNISAIGLNPGDKRKVFIAVKENGKNEVKLVNSKLSVTVK